MLHNSYKLQNYNCIVTFLDKHVQKNASPEKLQLRLFGTEKYDSTVLR